MMTREEATLVLDHARPQTAEIDRQFYDDEDLNAALDMGIKALEQEPILDKIRAEIEDLTYYWCEVHPRSVIDDVLEIIDKYKAESEVRE